MDLVVVVKLSTALLNVLDPVETSILNFWMKVLLDLTSLYLRSKPPRRIYAKDILLKRGRHKPQTTLGQDLMRLSFIYPEI